MPVSLARALRAIAAAAAFVTLTASVTATGVATAQPSDLDKNLLGAVCPALYALGVQGTGESSPDAAPTTDTGMLSTVFSPMMAKASEKGLVQHAYVPYNASFGGATGNDTVPYAQSVEGGLKSIRDMAQGIADRCPHTQFAVAGYSQGAHVASMFAQEVGQGHGVVPPDRLAGVALFADPTRNLNAPLFPGAPGKQSPDPAPGTNGDAVASVQALPQAPAAGGGIGPERDLAPNFGALTGRVATFCVSGDLACDAPDKAPILRVVSNIVGQSKLSGGDPIASLSSVAQALAFTTIKVATNVVNNDIQGNSLQNLKIDPQKSISQRLADASDPRTPLDINGAFKALLKVGMIGLNVVTSVVRTVLTPTNIAELATVGLTNPPAALLLLGTKLLGALPQLIPPTTVSNLVQGAFKQVVANISDNTDLLNTSTWVKYWDTIQRHGAYGTTTVTANGEAPVQFVADWFAAAAKDVAAVFGLGSAPAGGGSSGDLPFSGGLPTTQASSPGSLGDMPFSSGGSGSTPQPQSGGGQVPFQSEGGAPAPAPTTAGAPPGNYPFSTN